MARQHTYRILTEWTGNTGEGTSTYRSYTRDHVFSAEGKPSILGSSDPAFRGNPARYNPEDLMVAALSSCHMLSYLHLCAINNLVVESYEDEAIGTMAESADGGGRFTSVELRPKIRFRGDADLVKAAELHEEAHHVCFIANSVNFPVTCKPELSI